MGQNGRHFADTIFNHIFLNKNARISIRVSLNIVPKGPIENETALVHWRIYAALGRDELNLLY